MILMVRNIITNIFSFVKNPLSVLKGDFFNDKISVSEFWGCDVKKSS